MNQIPDDELVFLTSYELERIHEYSLDVIEFKKLNNVQDYKVGNKEPDYYDDLGFSGELAVHKYYGQEFPYALYKRRDKSYDIIVAGLKFDVKTSTDGVLKCKASIIDKIISGEYSAPSGYINVRNYPDDHAYHIKGVVSHTQFMQYKYRQGKWDILADFYISEIGKLNRLVKDFNPLYRS